MLLCSSMYLMELGICYTAQTGLKFCVVQSVFNFWSFWMLALLAYFNHAQMWPAQWQEYLSRSHRVLGSFPTTSEGWGHIPVLEDGRIGFLEHEEEWWDDEIITQCERVWEWVRSDRNKEPSETRKANVNEKVQTPARPEGMPRL